MSRTYFADIVRQFAGVKIAVLGDPILDYYHFGHCDRLSPEAPVPVFIEDKMDLRDGGAGNVAANLAALGCTAIPLFPPAPYTMKHRYLVGSQQLFRIDRDKDHSNQTPVIDWLPAAEAEAFVISDYAKGWCTRERCQGLIKAAKDLRVPVIVDPKGKLWHKYKGADVICPNEREFTERDPIHNWTPPAIVHKRGANGMELIEPNYETGIATIKIYPARARHVFDVTGAGDTVTAVLAAALAVRCEMDVAVELANIAAGIVVGEVGTTPCSAALLLAALA